MNDTVAGIGVIGASFAGSFHAEIWSMTPRARIAAVAELDESRRSEFAGRFGVERTYDQYADLLSDPAVDLVDVCLPNFLHAEVTKAALRAGKDVICEKPLATTLQDADGVVETARQSGRRVFYAEDWLFAPALVRARSIIDEGGIGNVLYCKGKEVHNGSHSPFAQTIKFCGGGSVIHLAVHPIGFFQAIFGTPTHVMGRCAGGLEQNMVHKQMEGEDWGLGVLTMPEGQQCLVEGNYVTTGGMDDVVEFYGTDGVMKVDLTFGSPISVYSREGYGYAIEKTDFTHGWTRPAVDEYYSLGYRDELRHFVDCILDGTEQMVGTRVEDGREVLNTVMAIYQSNRDGVLVSK